MTVSLTDPLELVKVSLDENIIVKVRPDREIKGKLHVISFFLTTKVGIRSTFKHGHWLC